MSTYNLEITFNRMKIAEPSSPILVFKAGAKDMFNSVFADTIVSRQIIKSKRQDIIGVYHKYNYMNFLKDMD